MRELESFCRLKMCLDIKLVILLAKGGPLKTTSSKKTMRSDNIERTNARIH